MPEQGIDENTRVILRDYGRYFEEHPGANQIEYGPFSTYFALRHPKVKPEVMEKYKAILKQLNKDPEPGVEAGIVERLVSLRTATLLQSALEGFDNGEVDLASALRLIHDEHEMFLSRRKAHPKVRDRIEDILEADENDTGLHWRLDCLNQSMRPLQPGDFGIIAARVDSGKTSFLASELTYFAPQIIDLWPDRERSILWFNNEGPGRRIKHRCFNAALGKSTKQLVEMKQHGSIYKEYVAALGGRDVIEIFDVHDYAMGEIETIIREKDPAMVVIDMLDNVRADGEVTNAGSRTDQVLEWLYQRARIWAVKYDCAVLATSQLSAEAEDVAFPNMANLANSRTGKAGASDIVLMLGRLHAEEMKNTRFISLPKNKKRREDGPQDPRSQVLFDGPRSLFKDPEPE